MARYEGRHRNAPAPSTAPRPNPATSSARSGATRHEAAPELSEAVRSHAAPARWPRLPESDGRRPRRARLRTCRCRRDAVARARCVDGVARRSTPLKSRGPQASRREADPGRRPRRRTRRLGLRLRQGEQHHRRRQRRVRRRQRRRRPDRRDGARRHRRHDLSRGGLGLAQRAPHRHRRDRPAHGHRSSRPSRSRRPRSRPSRPARRPPGPRATRSARASSTTPRTTRSRLRACSWPTTAGASDAQYNCLVNLWTGESDWRWSATNASSGAYGIPQSLPASKMAQFGADYRTNPLTQIKWGLWYIEMSYGNPCNAWSRGRPGRPTGTDDLTDAVCRVAGSHEEPATRHTCSCSVTRRVRSCAGAPGGPRGCRPWTARGWRASGSAGCSRRGWGR